MELKGKKITIMGLGRSGKALAEILLKEGASVFISDRSTDEALRESLAALSQKGVLHETGGHSRSVYEGKDLVIISPGVSTHAPVLREAREHGIPVIGEVELAYHFARSIPLVAVTGTNGKSTTVSLIHTMLTTWGKKSLLAGNIGTPLAGEVYKNPDMDFIVAEISSFQLETIASFKPYIGIVLNITTDHIDRHGSMDEYMLAKARLFENQDGDEYAVLNAEDPGCMRIARMVGSRCCYFSSRGPVARGAYVEGSDLFWKADGPCERVLSLSRIPLQGIHNMENVLALVSVAKILGVPVHVIIEAMKAFEPLHHRVEYVATVKGVDYYDDSKGTNPGAVIAALQRFDRPVILIAGGKDKNMDFGELGEHIARRVKTLVVIGETADRIAAAAEAHGMKDIRKAPTFREAIETCAASASPGDVVLLSPSCASFDMFCSAEERGDIFKSMVKEMEASPC